MTKLTRNLTITTVLSFTLSFTMLYFAKPLSILTTCNRDYYLGRYSDCSEFKAYFYGHFDGYYGDYSEYRDEFLWGDVGIIFFWIGFCLFIYLIYRFWRTKVDPFLIKLDSDVRRK